MKKIGIMSMHRIHNYGSFLQAYALKRVVENLNCKVTFVDYNYEKSIVTTNKKRNIIKKIIRNLNVCEYLHKKKYVSTFHDKFNNSFIPMLCDKKYNYNPTDIDELVIGSDEVFNCLQGYPVGYSKELFGKGYEKIPVISYAACFGQTNYDRLNEYGIADEIKELLNKFKSISVRDENSFDTVVKLTNKKPCINLDPVLIYDYKNEIIDNVKIKDYIVLYAYSGRLTKDEERKIKSFAKKYNKKIVSFGMYQRIADYNLIVNPFELFAYFKHADFVITDTFHGSILSIKSHSKFCAIIRNNNLGNSNKLKDLLKRMNLENRIISDINTISDYYNNDVDYKKVDTILNEEKKKTINYLSQELMVGDKNE